MHPDDICGGGNQWVFAQSAGQLAPLRPEQDAGPWAERNGGIPASGNHITLDVQNLNHHSVIIDQIQVKVVSSAPPSAGTIAYLSAGCGGLDPAYFVANLDCKASAKLRSVKAVSGKNDAGNVVEVVPLPHRLDDQEPSEQWRLELKATQCSSAVVPVVTWSSEGITGSFEITNHGGPWRVTSYSGATEAERIDGSGRWKGYGKAP